MAGDGFERENDDAGDDLESVDGAVRSRLDRLVERARSDRDAFEEPNDPPDVERAMRFLQEGVGQIVALYVHARTGGRFVHFDPEEYVALEWALNTWLELYARCYGVDLEADFTVREAAELLVETHNVRDVAQVLTGVPAPQGR